MKTIHFPRIYDLSSYSQLANLFKKFAKVGLTKEISDEFDLFASGGSNFSKNYGPANVALAVGNLILYDIFRDGAVIKVSDAEGKEDELISLRCFDAEKSDKHLKKALARKELCSTFAASLGASSPLKKVAEGAAKQLDYIESYEQISDFLNKKEVESTSEGERVKKINVFFNEQGFSADQILASLRRRLRENNEVNAQEILKVLKMNERLTSSITSNTFLLHRANFLEIVLSEQKVTERLLLKLIDDRLKTKSEYILLLDQNITASNKAKRIELLKEVADNEDIAFFLSTREAANHLGAIYLNDQDTKSAFKYFKIAADFGSIEAKLNLAMFYRNGLGTTTDFAKAIQLYEKVAECGNYDALIILALAFEIGENGHSKVMAEHKNFYKTFTVDDIGGSNIKTDEVQLTVERRFAEEEIFVKQDLERSAFYWKELLGIIPENEENRSLRKKINQNLERVSSQKKRVKKESADKAQKVQSAPEELSNEDRLAKLIKNYNKDRSENNKQALHGAMTTFFLEVIDAKKFSDHEPEFSQIASIADGDGGADLSQVARIIIDIKRAFSSSKDAKKRSSAKKSLIEQASFIVGKSSDNFTNENDKLFWEKVKDVVDGLIEASQQESLPKSQEIPASSSASMAAQIDSPTLTHEAAQAEPVKTLETLKVKSVGKEEKPVTIKPELTKEEVDARELRQLIENHKKEPNDRNKKLLHDSMVSFFLEAIKTEPEHFFDPIFSQIAAFNGSFPKENNDLDDLGLAARIITNIKKALSSQNEERRVEANEYLFGNIQVKKGIINHLLYLDSAQEDDKTSFDHLFWQEVLNFRRLIEAEQMSDFLKRDPSNPIKSTKDLPKFLHPIFDKLLKDGHQLSLKGSCINRSANSKRIPVDLDVDVFIQGISTWGAEEIQKFMRENFFCQCSIYRDAKNPKCITVSMKNGPTKIDICIYDQENKPEPNLTWSNSKDALRIKFDVNGNAEPAYVDGFNLYLSKIKSEMGREILFNPESDFILNPAGRGIILRACLLEAIEEIKEGTLNKALEETNHLENLLLLLNKELKLNKHTNTKMIEDVIKNFAEVHYLYGAPREKFIDCLNKVVDLAKSKNPKLSVFDGKNPLLPEDFTQRINYLEQAIENIEKECKPSSLPPALTGNAMARVLKAPKDPYRSQ